MIFIDENTPRNEMLDAVYGESDLFDHFLSIDVDPERLDDEALREAIQAWIEDEDEACSIAIIAA